MKRTTAALVSGLIAGTLVGHVLAESPEIRREAARLASTTAAAVKTCREVEAENRYLTSLGVGDLTRLDALGLLPYSATEPEEVIPDDLAEQEGRGQRSDIE